LAFAAVWAVAAVVVLVGVQHDLTRGLLICIGQPPGFLWQEKP